MSARQVATVMTREVRVLRVDAKPSDARRLLAGSPFHHLPIVDPMGCLVGILSSSDLLRFGFEAYGTDTQTMDALLDRQFSLREMMSDRVLTLRPEESIRRAAELLSLGSFHALPVIDAGRRVVGIVTSTDLITYLLERLPS